MRTTIFALGCAALFLTGISADAARTARKASKPSRIKVQITEAPASESRPAPPRKRASSSKPSLRAKRSPASATQKWGRCEEPPLGFALDVPAGWKHRMELDRGIVRHIYNASDPHVSIVVEVETSVDEAPARTWEVRDRQLREVFGKNYSPGAIVPAELGGRPAAVWTYSVREASGSALYKRDVRAERLGNSYVVRFCAPAATYSRWQGVFNHVENSFRFAVDDQPSGRVVTVWAKPEAGQ